MGGRGSTGGNVGSFNSRLTSVERSLRGETDREVGVILDETGKEIARMTSGERGEVRISAEDARKMTNRIFTHNHTDKSILSPADVQTAVNRNLLQMRAVTPDRTFVLERGKSSVDKKFAADYAKALNSYNSIYLKQSPAWRRQHPFQQATQEYGREWLKKNAGKYGYSYREE